MTRQRRIALIASASAIFVALAAGLIWFQPWKLWTDHRVEDALPALATASQPRLPAPTSTPTSTSTSTLRSSDVLLARGSLISHEHSTRGEVSVIRLGNGKRVLAIADLRTSEGPDVHVWLTDAPVKPGKDGWHVFDDGEHVSLGSLKGNLGNQIYPIPDTADLSRLTSVSIWCDRFNVSFGAAQLVAV